MNQSKIFTSQQVQIACQHLLNEEAHLIVDGILPRRCALVADIFARMMFDGHHYIDSDLMSPAQIELLEKYN
jgi:hypothetical protein